MAGPNILLIVLDSVRARNVGAYGHHRDTTPFLTKYGRRATFYEEARAPGIHSVASHASLWTGAHVEQHEVVEHQDQLRSGTTIWEELAEAGYRTGIFTTNPVVTHASNLSEPFDEESTGSPPDSARKPFPNAHSPTDVITFEGVTGNLRRCVEDDRPVRSFFNSAYHLYAKNKDKVSGETLSSSDIVDGFLDWVAESEESWAACINLMDAHYPYEPGEEYDEWGGTQLADLHSGFSRAQSHEFVQDRPWWQLEVFEHLYDGAIRELDAHLEQLVAGLKRYGVHDDTIVVVTSDHGEGFGEVSRVTGRTRLVDHSWGIHEVLTHVPLIVKYPGQVSGETVPDLVSLTGFPATVREAVEGDVKYDSFVSREPVVSSTCRLREEDGVIFDGSNERAADYYGPWRAVYRQVDETVYKYATRGEDSVAIEIRNAQFSSPVDASGTETVRTTFGQLEPLNLKRSKQNDLASGVEDRLTDLGYLT